MTWTMPLLNYFYIFLALYYSNSLTYLHVGRFTHIVLNLEPSNISWVFNTTYILIFNWKYYISWFSRVLRYLVGNLRCPWHCQTIHTPRSLSRAWQLQHYHGAASNTLTELSGVYSKCPEELASYHHVMQGFLWEYRLILAHARIGNNNWN